MRSSRSLLLLGFFSCLVGMLCVVGSYFLFPLYSVFAFTSYFSPTHWELLTDTVHSMQLQNYTVGFIFPITIEILPLVCALFLAVLGSVRVLSTKPVWAKLFRIIVTLGLVPLVGFLLFVVVALRLGALGELTGYVLLFLADRFFRRARALQTA